MKKDRSTFFQEAQMSSFNYYPNPNQMNLMSANMPTQASQSSQSFYAGPAPMYQQTPNSSYNDIESRIAKLERQVSRLETRLNKLESQSPTYIDEYDTSTNMYMV